MKDKRVIKPSVIIVIFLMLFILYTSNGNGAIARALYGDALLESTDSVFPYMVTQLMPEWHRAWSWQLWLRPRCLLWTV